MFFGGRDLEGRKHKNTKNTFKIMCINNKKRINKIVIFYQMNIWILIICINLGIHKFKLGKRPLGRLKLH